MSIQDVRPQKNVLLIAVRIFLFALLLIALCCLALVCFEILIVYNNTVNIEKRAQSGNVNSQRTLAFGYETGSLAYYSLGRIRRDHNIAVYWYEQAARQGDVKACLRLVTLYEQDNTDESNNRAVYWRNQAASLSASEAKKSTSWNKK